MSWIYADAQDEYNEFVYDIERNEDEEEIDISAAYFDVPLAYRPVFLGTIRNFRTAPQQ